MPTLATVYGPVISSRSILSAHRLRSLLVGVHRGDHLVYVGRVGTGFDVHGFVAGDGVTICGVRIAHTKKLEGYSDADVGWHALTDAILGAAALGDIGDHFPPSDPKWKGADSLVFLQHAAKLAGGRGLRVVNADITLMCEKPKISPHREAMRAKTAEALAIPLDADRRWFKARVGLDACETARDSSFCAYAMHGDDVMVVEDALLDPRRAHPSGADLRPKPPAPQGETRPTKGGDRDVPSTR